MMFALIKCNWARVKTFFRLLILKRYSEKEWEIIPQESPWYFRWGLPAVRTISSYQEYEKIIENTQTDETPSLIKASEKYLANSFACRYGRRGNSRLRALVEEAQYRGIATEDEMRALVRYGDIRGCKNDKVRISAPTYSAIGAVIYLFITTSYYLLMLLLLTIVAPGGLLANLQTVVLLTLVYLGCSLPSYSGVIRPFLITRRIASSLKKLDEQLAIIRSANRPYVVR